MIFFNEVNDFNFEYFAYFREFTFYSNTFHYIYGYYIPPPMEIPVYATDSNIIEY